jgi:pyrimidine oxygenase
MRLGVFTPTGNNGWIASATSPQYLPTFELNRSVTQRAESYGFDFSLCMVKFRGFGGEIKFWDYTLETFTLMSALAAVTDQIRIYCSVGVLSLHPAMVARMASTIDSVAPGRFGINIVSGWNRQEYAQMGLWPGDEYYEYRYDYASEYVAVMKELWERGQSDFRGRFFQLEDCRLGPQPSAHIDILAAGASLRGRQFAAEHADFNFTSSPTGVDGLHQANAELAAASAATGRTVQTILLTSVVLDDTDELARKKVEHYSEGTDLVAAANRRAEYARDYTGVSSARGAQRLANPKAKETSGALIGSPRTVADQLNRLAAVPGTGGILMSFDDYHEGLDRFGTEVIPRLDFDIADHTPTVHAATA